MSKQSQSLDPGRQNCREFLALRGNQLEQTKGTVNHTAGGQLTYFITQEVRQVENTHCSLKGLEKPVGYGCVLASWVDCDF